MIDLLPDLATLLPELVLGVGIFTLLVVGVIRGDGGSAQLSWAALLLLALVAVLLVAGDGNPRVAMNGMFIDDAFARLMKLIILAGSAAALIMSVDYLRFTGTLRFEFPILMLTATLGMLMMVSAADLISLYLGLELQSLSLYVLAAFHRDHRRSSEAGLKYFVLGALSSGMLLYGASLLYGFTGTTSFANLSATLPGMMADGAPVALVFGLVLVLAGLAFKISAVPFHMWTPDVYEGSPTAVTAFFAGAPKVAAMAMLLRLLYEPLAALSAQSQQIIVFVSIASMILGAVAAIAQRNIKRLMAYSSIGHVGYALVGLAAGGEAGLKGVILYMAAYLVMTVGSFLCILAMRRPEGMVEDISELAGLARTRPGLAAALATFMISLIGFPPFAGFWAKLFVFRAAIEQGLYTLAVVGMVTSVIGAFYYLRVIKIMYFDEPAADFERSDDRASGMLLGVTALIASPASFAFFFPLVPVVERAARALIG